MSAGDSRPPSKTASPSDSKPESDTGDSEEDILTRFRTAQSGPLMFIREVLTSVAAVAAIGLVLFAISGVWPPMVAVESGSMQPNMHKGDLVFITAPNRFAPDAGHGETGVVTYREGKQTDYRSFGSYGSVIVYDTPGQNGPPIIHRARFFVHEGENWYDRANKNYLPPGVDNCAELEYCPATRSGFITKGDNNGRYDQASNIAPPVQPAWVTGIARIRIPYLGWIRLGFSGQAFAVSADAPAAHNPTTYDASALSASHVTSTSTSHDAQTMTSGNGAVPTSIGSPDHADERTALDGPTAARPSVGSARSNATVSCGPSAATAT